MLYDIMSTLYTCIDTAAYRTALLIQSQERIAKAWSLILLITLLGRGIIVAHNIRPSISRVQ